MAKTEAPNPVEALSALLTDITPAEIEGASERVRKAVALGAHLQTRGHKLQTNQEKRQQAEFEKVVQDEEGKATLTQLTDQAFRAQNVKRIADQLTHILDVQGIPRFFTAVDRAMLRGFQSFGSFLPGVSVPLVKGKMREETANVILPAEEELLSKHLRDRRAQSLRMNVNFLGEALLGEDDAAARLKSYLRALQMPEIEVISVKVSTLYSQLTPLSRRHAVATLADRLELLYRASTRERYVRADGTEVSKFVYLDMEEYRDLAVTVDTFIEALSRKGLEKARGGIALQAYIPDSYAAQQRINEWARERVKNGGAPVTIRLVKGANMETERVHASIEGWPQAPYDRKLDTDANFKKMLHSALEPENIVAVRLGVASHNLFEVAYALVLANENGVIDKVQFEMLEGMVNHQRRAVGELAPSLLLYAPATEQEQFVNAIGYLIRRLDENTGPDNFLRHAFKLKVGSDEWNRLQAMFVESASHMEHVDSSPRRRQDRSVERSGTPDYMRIDAFQNEPDTDFSLDQNLAWAEEIVATWKGRCGEHAMEVPAVVAGVELLDGRTIKESYDPSRPGTAVARYRQANSTDIETALSCARNDPSGWRSMGEEDRCAIMTRVAETLRRRRADLIGVAIAEGGKTISEVDPEISEAIDFVVYYTAAARGWRALPSLEASPLGVVVVVPPWNFPVAIPCGGVAASLAAGNTVILKPASDVVAISYLLCKCFWEAGVPWEALQFVPCSGSTGGAQLVASDEVDAVILTGGTETALRMLEAKPSLHLLAETGGKNATIVTAMSDREQAIAHVIQSAFGHSGQKCSATSLLILEGEVYDDPEFRSVLVDAAKSMKVGSAWELDTRIGPMIGPPSGDLERGLKDLESGESWALLPKKIDGNPNLYSPGIKWGSVGG